jgi:hypothetical protein
MRLRTKMAVSTLPAVVCVALAGSGQAAARHPPAGSYQQTCSNIAFSNAGVLSAQCKDAQGRSVLASLRVPACGKGDIANANGLLICQPLFIARPKRPPPPTHPGPLHGALPAASVILFEDIDFKGRTLEVASDTLNLTVNGFNDKASSIRVNGGRWQLCVDANFRGHCTILDKDAPNLSRFNLNDRVSSVRRVG